MLVSMSQRYSTFCHAFFFNTKQNKYSFVMSKSFNETHFYVIMSWLLLLCLYLGISMKKLLNSRMRIGMVKTSLCVWSLPREKGLFKQHAKMTDQPAYLWDLIFHGSLRDNKLLILTERTFIRLRGCAGCLECLLFAYSKRFL